MTRRRCSGWVIVNGVSRECVEEGRFFHGGKFWCKNCRDRMLKSPDRWENAPQPSRGALATPSSVTRDLDT